MSDKINLTVKSYSTLDDIDFKEWNSIVNANNSLNLYEYQKAIEKSNINNFRYSYFMFYERDSLVAHVSTGILAFDLDMFAGKFLKKIISGARHVFKNFFKITMIECGHPTALGTTIEITDKSYYPEVLRLLDLELTKLAKKEKTSLIAIRDFYSNQRNYGDKLFNFGYKILLNMPNTILKTTYKDFDDYLSDLSTKRRSEIKRHLNDFYKNNCSIEKITDFTDLAGEIETLWKNTYFQAKEYQREVLNKEYFLYISEFLKEKAFVFLCKHNETPIGFTMFVDSGETLISTYCGLDYEYNRKSSTYFVLFYKSIEEAIKLKKKYLELGITNYNPKIEIGAIPQPTYIYAKSTNPLLNLIFVPLLKSINTMPDFNKRNIFNKRHFERNQIFDKIKVVSKNRQLYLKDISFDGFSAVCNEKFAKNKIFKFKITEADFEIELKAKVINSIEIEGQSYITGFTVTMISKEFLPNFYYLVSDYQSRKTFE